MKKTIEWVSTTEAKPWVRRTAKAVGLDRNGDLEITGEKGQVWEGFGGCFNELGWIALEKLRAADRQRVLRDLFDPQDGCRFTINRIPIGASDYAAEWYSHNEHEGDFAMRHFSIARDRRYLLPYIKAALAIQPGMQFFASPWSPPTWMKFPRAHNHGTLVWRREYLEAYARYFVKFVQAYRQEGVTISQIHPQNEPVADQKFPSCVWTGAQLRDFIRDHLGPVFARQKLDCEIWLGTLNTDDYNGYPLTVLSDPAANRYVAGVGFQWAGKGAIQRTRASWPDKRLMQTENECGDGKNTWAYAEYVFGLLQHYLVNGASAYVYWNMVLEAGGRSTWGWRQNSMITVDPGTRRATYQPEFHVMRHFARYIDVGAVRLEMAGPLAGNAVAFLNPDGRRVVVVHNPLDQVRKMTVVGNAGHGLDALLPARSFNTFVFPG